MRKHDNFFCEFLDVRSLHTTTRGVCEIGRTKAGGEEEAEGREGEKERIERLSRYVTCPNCEH